jgi:hypothetical protein
MRKLQVQKGISSGRQLYKALFRAEKDDIAPENT